MAESLKVTGNIEVRTSPTITTTIPDIPVVSSLASGLSALATGFKNAITGKANVGKLKLPMPNQFWKYSSYNYVFTLFAIDTVAYNNPGATYMQGKGDHTSVVLSGAGKPNTRVKTDLGKFEFYIDDVIIDCKYGFTPQTGNSHVQTLKFTIYEPYSMGTFMLALQSAAFKMGYPSYTACNFVLAVQFMGQDQSGSMSSIPNTTKYFTFSWNGTTEVDLDQGGSKYMCTAKSSAESALLHSNINITREISFAGRTVSEVLQTHPQSFAAMYNKQLKEIAEANGYYPDEIAILFPADIASASAPPAAAASSNYAPTVAFYGAKAGATPTPDLLTIVGVSRNGQTKNLIQQSALNELGSSPIGVGPSRESLPESFGAKIYDETTRKWDETLIKKDITVATYEMQQNSTVINAINQVLLSSEYSAKVLKTKPDEMGMRKMWNIVPSEYHVEDKTTVDTKGRKPKLLVYRVVPYQVLAASLIAIPGATVAADKYKNLLDQIPKAYDYFYTGKNTDIINLQIKFNQNFASYLANDNYRRSLELTTEEGRLRTKQTDIVFEKTNPVYTPAKGLQNILNFIGTSSETNKKGGGPNDTEDHRATRSLFDAMLYGATMMQIEMEIHGDPYWLASSGSGNYIAKETQYANVNSDLSVNIHNGEVHMIVRFKTPTDINDSTGLYNLNGSQALLQYSGIYKVLRVEHRFVDGKFTQRIFANKNQIEGGIPKGVDYSPKKTIPRVPDTSATVPKQYPASK
jgi:hypothetical protein